MTPPLRFSDAVPLFVGDTPDLRELAEADIPSWFERATDREAADLAGDPVPVSIADGAAWLQRHREWFRQRRAIRWAIVPHGSAISMGTVGLILSNAHVHTASLAVVVARACWGGGVGSAAVAMALGCAYAELGLSEVQAEVLERNTASVRLLEKCGFVLATVLPPTADEPEVLLLYKCTGPRPDAGQA